MAKFFSVAAFTAPGDWRCVMTSITVEKKKCTYEDYLKTPEDTRYELIHGELLMTPSPVPRHQLISGRLELKLREYVMKHNLGEIYDAPCDVYLDNENVVQPDVLFISQGRLNIVGKKNIQGAPDLVIEIISDYSVYRDMVQKKKLYALFGVPEYWIVVPEEEEIQMYLLKKGTYRPFRTYSKGDVLETPSLKGLRIDLKEIF